MSGKNEVELKGGMYTFMSLKLHTADLSVIDARIADKVQQAPGFFKDSPVVVDLSGVEQSLDDGQQFDTVELFDRIRAHKLVPIVASVADKSSPFASAIALPLMETGAKRSQDNKRGNKQSKEKTSTEDASDLTDDMSADESEAGSAKTSMDRLVDSLNGSPVKERPVSLVSGGRAAGSTAGQTSEPTSKQTSGSKSSNDDDEKDNDSASTEEGLNLAVATEVEVILKAPMLMKRPVRSGQQVYARDTDLIIMGQVGAGAEVLADQNIHVYGPLRGRALCGASGNSDTRIFCQSLEAEMVSVDGVFRVLEEIPADLRGKPAQIWLDNGKLNIEPL